MLLQVREIVAFLDLDVLFYPCPKNGPNFRPRAVQMGGKKQFPYMVRYCMNWSQESVMEIEVILFVSV